MNPTFDLVAAEGWDSGSDPGNLILYVIFLFFIFLFFGGGEAEDIDPGIYFSMFAQIQSIQSIGSSDH